MELLSVIVIGFLYEEANVVVHEFQESFVKLPTPLSKLKIYPDRFVVPCQYKECRTGVPASVELIDDKEYEGPVGVDALL